MTTRQQDRFEDALRDWAARPLDTSAEKAAREVIARLPERRTGGWAVGPSWQLGTAAAGLALLLVVGWMTLPTAPESSRLTDDLALPPIPHDVVLLWLDDETPLYLTVAPPATEGGPR